MSASGTAVLTIGRLDAQIREWIAKWGGGSANGRTRVLDLKRLEALLAQGKSLIESVRDESARDADTEKHLRAYGATLRELQGLIVRQEIAARMRRAQIESAQLRLLATTAWASRVRQLG
jgi:hypothetical protein